MLWSRGFYDWEPLHWKQSSCPKGPPYPFGISSRTLSLSQLILVRPRAGHSRCLCSRVPYPSPHAWQSLLGEYPVAWSLACGHCLPTATERVQPTRAASLPKTTFLIGSSQMPLSNSPPMSSGTLTWPRSACLVASITLRLTSLGAVRWRSMLVPVLVCTCRQDASLHPTRSIVAMTAPAGPVIVFHGSCASPTRPTLARHASARRYCLGLLAPYTSLAH